MDQVWYMFLAAIGLGKVHLLFAPVLVSNFRQAGTRRYPHANAGNGPKEATKYLSYAQLYVPLHVNCRLQRHDVKIHTAGHLVSPRYMFIMTEVIATMIYARAMAIKSRIMAIRPQYLCTTGQDGVETPPYCERAAPRSFNSSK